MIEDKIQLALKDIAKLKEKLREIKKDLRYEEKVVDDQYQQLKVSYREMRLQIKGMEEDLVSELQQDESYNQLRELKVKTEEDLALANEKLFQAIAKLPQKPFDMSLETEEGPLKVQVQPEMRVYINGKEEKKRAV